VDTPRASRQLTHIGHAGRARDIIVGDVASWPDEQGQHESRGATRISERRRQLGDDILHRQQEGGYQVVDVRVNRGGAAAVGLRLAVVKRASESDEGVGEPERRGDPS
jgi:hypothetical protein